MEWISRRWKVGSSWRETDAGFRQRAFSSYAAYVARQKRKLGRIDLSRYDVNYRAILRERLEDLRLLRPGMSVLCLAARIGTEVKSFLDLGCFAVGIDLNPGPENRYVLHGDFHDLQFASGSVDLVFTNSLDHAFSVDRLIAESARVLKPDGLLLLEVSCGSGGGKRPGHYESFWWASVADVIALFEDRAFQLIRRRAFDAPWIGEQLCFRRPE